MAAEASGFLVGPTVFKTDETDPVGLAGSIPVRLRSARNHCRNCLWSLHVDVRPGDRAARCGAAMEPIAVSVRGRGEWVLVHRCGGCATLALNRTAGDDSPLLLIRVAVAPLAQPPFQIERIVGSL